MFARMTAPQVWAFNFILVMIMFMLGMWIGGLEDPTMAIEPNVVEVEVPTGDVEDVVMRMESTMGTTFSFLCDIHLTLEGNTAECEYTEP